MNKEPKQTAEKIARESIVQELTLRKLITDSVKANKAFADIILRFTPVGSYTLLEVLKLIDEGRLAVVSENQSLDPRCAPNTSIFHTYRPDIKFTPLEVTILGFKRIELIEGGGENHEKT